MSGIWALNLAGASVAIGLSIYLGVAHAPAQRTAPAAAATLTVRTALVKRHGQSGLLDASGRFVALRDYRRIAAASTLANELLLLLCEPDRIAAFTRLPSAERARDYRFAGKPRVAGAAAAEALIALRPDLVVLNGQLAGGGRVERLREAGLAVFDLGAMRGLRTLLPSIQALGTLLGRAETGAELAQRFARRMRMLATAIPAASRPLGLYLSLYGDVLSGGTDGTSYHDVLLAAGIRDVAAAAHDDWPRYTPETVLRLDPDLIVTHTGMAAQICAQPGLDRLRACRVPRIIELDPVLLGDPGLGMIDAAEVLFERVHGSAP